MKKVFFIIIVMFFQASGSVFYSVGICPEKSALFYICQEGISELSLYSYDYISKEHNKLLSRFFKPVSFRLLPDHRGFSFLQHDSLYIKYFSKRSPKRVEFYEPIYGINTIEWLDNKTFYFAAREHGNYNIYKANLEGDVELLLHQNGYDLLYPQIFGQSVYCIVRNEKNVYSVMLCNLNSHEKKVLQEAANGLAHLHMITDNKGFFLSYETKPNGLFIEFGYHILKKVDHEWRDKKLFHFKIPSKYLLENSLERVYESIAPFLPRFDNETIYFVDYNGPNEVYFKKYSLSLEKEDDVIVRNLEKHLVPGIFSKEEFLKNFN